MPKGRSDDDDDDDSTVPLTEIIASSTGGCWLSWPARSRARTWATSVSKFPSPSDMPVTEFASFAFKPGHSHSDPAISALFGKVASWQSAWSGFPLLYYTNPAVPTEIHLITGWSSVDAHDAWIASAPNQELLAVFTPYIDILSMVHLDIDFDRFPRDAPTITCVRQDEEIPLPGYLVGRNMAAGHKEVYGFSVGEVATEGVVGARTLERVHFPLHRD